MSNPLRPRHGAPTLSLRTDMPTVAAWIDQLREAFGKEEIHAAIRNGQGGQAGFYAREGGKTIGTPFMTEHNVWHGDGLEQRHFCTGCTGQCVGTDRRCNSKKETLSGSAKLHQQPVI